MVPIVKDKKVFISVKEIINYLDGMKQDMINEWENQKKEVNKRVENLELQKIILNLDEDNFKLFIGKLNAMS